MARRSKKKTRIKSSIDLDLLNMYGSMPEYTGAGPENDKDYKIKLHHALNWCSRGLDTNKGKHEFVFWISQNGHKDKVQAIKALDENELMTVGRLAFLANNGWPLDFGSINYINKSLEKLGIRGTKRQIDQASDAKETARIEKLREENKTSTDSLNAIEAQTISEEIEQLVWNKKEFPDVAVRQVILDKKAIVLNKAANRLKAIVEELTEIDNDEQLAEAYAHLTKREVKYNIENLTKAVEVMGQEKLNKKVIRKPRKKKVKSAAQQLVKFKYREKDNTLGVVSVDPVSIIGATKLIIFNTKTRKLGIYYAKDELGFHVKGTTLQNFCDKQSKQKTIRDTKTTKMVDVVRKFRTAAPTRSDKMFAELTTTETILNGRFNDDVLLLKTYK